MEKAISNPFYTHARARASHVSLVSVALSIHTSLQIELGFNFLDGKITQVTYGIAVKSPYHNVEGIKLY
jgi:hypothetical protein